MTRLAGQAGAGRGQGRSRRPAVLAGRARMRGREDGAAGSVPGPFSFMHWTMELCAGIAAEGIVIVFCMGERSH